MTEYNQSAKRDIRNKIAVSLTILAIFIILLSIGRSIALPWTMSTTVKNVVSTAASDGGGVVSDQSGTRLIFTDSAGRVTNIVESSITDEIPTHYGQVACDSSAAYVIEFTYFDGTNYIDSLRIAKYDFDGERLATLKELSYDLRDNATIKSPVFDLYVSEGQGCLLMTGVSGNDLFLQTFPLDSDAGMSDELIELGTLPDGRMVSRINYSQSDGQLEIIDDIGNVYTCDAGKAHSLVTMSEGDTSKEMGDSPSVSSVIYEDEVLSSAPLRMVSSILLWISVLYLVVLCTFLAVRFVKSCLQNEQFDRLKKLMTIVLIACLVIGIVAFYSVNLLSVENRNKSSALSATAAATVAGHGDEFVDAIVAYRQDGVAGADSYNWLRDKLEQMALAAAREGQGIYYTLVCEGNDGIAVMLLSSSKLTYTGKQVVDSDGNPLTFEDGVQMADGDTSVVQNYDSITATALVEDADGNTVGVLTVNTSASSFDAKSIRQCISVLLILVNAIMILMFIVFEFGAWIEQLAKRRKLIQLSAPAAEIEITLARPLIFLTVAANGCLVVLLPLITNDLVAGTAWENNGFVIAIPQMAVTLAQLASVPLTNWLSKRMKLRSYMPISTIIGVLFFCVGGVCVSLRNIVFMSISVFMAVLFTNMPFIYANKLPLLLCDKIQRGNANRMLAATLLSANVLSGLLSGELTETFGNQYAFYIAAVFGVILFVLELILLPRTNNDVVNSEVKEKVKKTCAKDYLKFLFDPLITALLLCIEIPVSILSGYQSYLFPLLANQNGLDKATISSIVVYCYAICYVLTPMISVVESKIRLRTLIVTSGFMLSGIFSLFILNDSMAWLIVILIAVTLTYKIVQPAITTLWQNRSIQIQVPNDAAYTSAFLVDRLGSFLRSPSLGILLTVCGSTLVCPVIGMVYGILTAIFAVVSVIRSES